MGEYIEEVYIKIKGAPKDLYIFKDNILKSNKDDWEITLDDISGNWHLFFKYTGIGLPENLISICVDDVNKDWYARVHNSEKLSDDELKILEKLYNDVLNCYNSNELNITKPSKYNKDIRDHISNEAKNKLDSFACHDAKSIDHQLTDQQQWFDFIYTTFIDNQILPSQVLIVYLNQKHGLSIDRSKELSLSYKSGINLLKYCYKGEQINSFICKRKSIRNYKEILIGEKECEAILNAGKHAPSGKNRQSWFFIFIQKENILLQLKDLVREAMRDFKGSKKDYFAKEDISHITTFGKSKKGIEHGYEANLKIENFSFMFNAPLIVIVAGDPRIDTTIIDCAAAMENMILAAHMMGIGSCWLQYLSRVCRYQTEDNEAKTLNSTKKLYDFLVELGMPNGYMVYSSACFGYHDNLVKDVREFRPDDEIRKMYC